MLRKALERIGVAQARLRLDAAAIIALAMVAAQDYKDGKKIAAAIPS